jgi:hypothetical protein
MDPIDREWREFDLAQMINDYEKADQEEFAAFMAETDDPDWA